MTNENLTILIYQKLNIHTIDGFSSYPFSGFRKPFNIVVHTDSAEGTVSAGDPDTNNRGFCLDFVQQPCGTASGK